MNLGSLLKEQNEDRLSRIFNADCEGSILEKIARVFETVLAEMASKQTEGVEQEAQFMLLFFQSTPCPNQRS